MHNEHCTTVGDVDASLRPPLDGAGQSLRALPSVRRAAFAFGAATVLVGVAACGSSSAPVSQGAAQPTAASVNLGSVSLVTGAKNIIAADLPFVVAEEKGYYKAAGLDVNIIFGDGYDTALRVVAAGKGDYAETDLASITGAVDEALPVQSVAIYSQISPAGLVFHSGKAIKGPGDIRGLKIATSAGSGSGKVFDAWLKANSLTDKDFTRVVVPGHEKPIVFAQKKVDAYVGLGYDDLPEARKTAGGADFYYFATDKITVPGVAVAASKSEISGHGDRVKAFLAATKKGYDDSVADVPAAVAAAQKLQPTTDPKLLTDQWTIFIAAEKNSTSTGGWGMQSEDSWKQTVKVFGKAGSPRALSDYFTNAYIPAP